MNKREQKHRASLKQEVEEHLQRVRELRENSQGLDPDMPIEEAVADTDEFDYPRICVDWADDGL